MGILLLQVVVRLSPLRHSGAMPHHHSEEGVQQEHSVRHHRGHIQHHWLGLRAVHGVGLQGWLDHGDGGLAGLPVQHDSAVGCLIRAVAKHLQSSCLSDTSDDYFVRDRLRVTG